MVIKLKTIKKKVIFKETIEIEFPFYFKHINGLKIHYYKFLSKSTYIELIDYIEQDYISCSGIVTENNMYKFYALLGDEFYISQLLYKYENIKDIETSNENEFIKVFDKMINYIKSIKHD